MTLFWQERNIKYLEARRLLMETVSSAAWHLRLPWIMLSKHCALKIKDDILKALMLFI